MQSQSLEKQLNTALLRYRQPAFIQSDPMQFPHRLRHDVLRCELASLLAALMAYGSRPLVLRALSELWQRLDEDPYSAMMSWSRSKLSQRLNGFVYRFYKGSDLLNLLLGLRTIYNEFATLEQAFLKASDTESVLSERLGAWMAILRAACSEAQGKPQALSYGLRYLLPDPYSKGACKRLHLFLRWVVRDDADLEMPIDFGLWKESLRPAQLLMPIDTHVARLSLYYGLCTRKTNDWAKAESVTQALARYRPEDPVAYDFALLGLGVDRVDRDKRYKN